MKNENRGNLFGAGAFLVGLLGFQAYAVHLKKDSAGGDPVRVLVATQDLKAGVAIEPRSLGVQEIPSDYVDERRILEAERKNLIGVSLQHDLRAGEALVWSDLSDGSAHRHLAAVVLPGRRAYSLEASANPLGRLLRVGDHVDVLVESNGESQLLLQRVLVLAVGGEMLRSEVGDLNSSSSARGVTVSVTVEQSESLLAAESEGDLRLILRNPEDLKKRALRQLETVAASAGSRPFAQRKEIEHVQ